MDHYCTYTDEALIELLRKNDHKAFAELYERYWDKLFFLAGKKLDDLYEAEHIVQDIFLDLWNRRTELDIHESLGGYLVVAVKYRIINAQAKRYKQSVRQKENAGSLPQHDNSTEHWLTLRELQDSLHHQLARLPEKCALAFSLRDDGLSYKQIAAEMNISEKTVEMHISRAFKALRTSLGSFINMLILMLSCLF
ncbi:RNA polymerase sigma factor [Longitalea arenae]|uniref:RNA polymerase sigma factor n=1 Tax=Longitalea arenae TaxID=2812558 RepID=UPI0019685861|nr:RNA polymerase sigma-70 factor [Longitalea arenae]